MTGVSYADLIAHAQAHITDAGSPRNYERIDNPTTARAAIRARAHLLEAISAHVWAIITPARRIGHSHGTDPTERAAVALANELHTVLAANGTKGPPPRHRSHPWDRAAVQIRAASDLLAVHHDDLARPRSPDAQAWASANDRAAALAVLGPMAVQALDAEGVLALRAGQAHLPWAEIRRLLPDTTTARALAATLASDGHLAQPASRFGSLRLIGEPPRTDSPIHELTDRITRIRHLTWDLLQHPDSSTATLRDLATLATAVHAHTVAYHTAPGVPLSRNVQILLARARAWQHTAHDLAEYHTPAPSHPEIHAHVRATTRLLAQIAPLKPPPGGPVSRPVSDEVSATLRSAASASDKIQDWASQVFGRMADRTELRVPASTLSRDLVTDEPSLAHAKLIGGPVIAPKSRTHQTIERYRGALPAGSALTARSPRSPLEPALEPMIIQRRQ